MKKDELYNVYRESFIKELSKRKGIVANTDIDGILSSALLCSIFPNLSIVGFTNSDTNIYLCDNFKKEDLVYLDIFMCDNDVFCVDNHIVGSKYNPILNLYKINPNLIYNVYLEIYTQKYPFSTFIFLLSMINDNMEHIDIEIEVGKTPDGESVLLWELLLRADDTLLNTYKYCENTANWWERLLSNSSNSLLIKLYNKVREVGNKNNAQAIKDKVQNFLLSSFGVKKDGFKNAEHPMFKEFFTYFTELMKYSCKYPKIDKNYCLISEKKNITEIENIKKEYDVKTLAVIDKNTISFSHIPKKVKII